MAPEILTKQGGNLTILDAVLIAGAKTTTERLSAHLIGNGTLFSGAIKIGVSTLLIGKAKNKYLGLLGTAMMVDGGEDIVTALIGGKAIANLGNGIQQDTQVNVI